MQFENAYYSEAVHGPFELVDIGDLVLEEGPTLRGCQLAYQTLGTLNDAKDNAVLVTTWYSGNHSVMRETYVGAGRAIDPAEQTSLPRWAGSRPRRSSCRSAVTSSSLPSTAPPSRPSSRAASCA